MRSIRIHEYSGGWPSFVHSGRATGVPATPRRRCIRLMSRSCDKPQRDKNFGERRQSSLIYSRGETNAVVDCCEPGRFQAANSSLLEHTELPCGRSSLWFLLFRPRIVQEDTACASCRALSRFPLLRVAPQQSNSLLSVYRMHVYQRGTPQR